MGGVDISILLWIGRELLKSVSFEVNLSGCPSARACRAEPSDEQTGPLLGETNPDVLQGSLKKTRSPFSIVPSRLSYRNAELGLIFPCLHIVSLGLCCFNNWGEIWTLLKSCP